MLMRRKEKEKERGGKGKGKGKGFARLVGQLLGHYTAMIVGHVLVFTGVTWVTLMTLFLDERCHCWHGDDVWRSGSEDSECIW